MTVASPPASSSTPSPSRRSRRSTNRSSSHHPHSLNVFALRSPTSARDPAALATAATAFSFPMLYDPTRNSVRGSRRSSSLTISPSVSQTSSCVGNAHRGSQYVVSNSSSPIAPSAAMRSCSAGSSRTRSAARKSPVCSAVRDVLACFMYTSTAPGQWFASKKVTIACDPSAVSTRVGVRVGTARTRSGSTPRTSTRSDAVTGEQYIGAGPLNPGCKPVVWSLWKCVRKYARTSGDW